MRRVDREILDDEQILAIMKQSLVVRVAFFDEQYPYIIPMSFGVQYDAGKFVLYLHCAKEGKKLQLLAKNPHVAFEMESKSEVVLGKSPCGATMKYESVCGNGVITIAESEEMASGLAVIMEQYDSNKQEQFEPNAVKQVIVLRLEVDNITGKASK